MNKPPTGCVFTWEVYDTYNFNGFIFSSTDKAEAVEQVERLNAIEHGRYKLAKWFRGKE